MKKLILPCLVLGLFLSGCAIKHEDSTKSYHLNESGCDTGDHSFSTSSDSDTLSQYCAALQDDAANNGCAETLRRANFEASCPGTWSPH